MAELATMSMWYPGRRQCQLLAFKPAMPSLAPSDAGFMHQGMA